MAAPHWHLMVRRRGSETERLLSCPRCGAWVSISEAQQEGRERIWCLSPSCTWNDLADLSAYRE